MRVAPFWNVEGSAQREREKLGGRAQVHGCFVPDLFLSEVCT